MSYKLTFFTYFYQHIPVFHNQCLVSLSSRSFILLERLWNRYTALQLDHVSTCRRPSACTLQHVTVPIRNIYHSLIGTFTILSSTSSFLYSVIGTLGTVTTTTGLCQSFTIILSSSKQILPAVHTVVYSGLE